MKLVGNVRQHIRRLFSRPTRELGAWARFAVYQVRLWRHCGRTLHRNNSAAMSAALSFRMIFALIPALVLALLMAKSVGGFERYQEQLRAAMVASGLDRIRLTSPSEEQAAAAAAATQPTSQPAPRAPVPAGKMPSPIPPNAPATTAPIATTVPAAVATRPTAPGPSRAEPQGDSVADWIERLAEKVDQQLTLGRVGPVGLVLFIWTALTLLTQMERSLNRVFGAPRSRSMARRVLVYWSVITLGPLALSAAIFVTNRATHVLSSVPFLAWLMRLISWAGPILVGVVLLALLYVLMPNTKVRFASAVGGAFVTVTLWLVAKWGFMLYVTELSGSLYGALGLLPLFLMWVNISWWLWLFGAQLAYTAANLQQMEAAEEADRELLSAWDLLAATGVIAERHQQGLGPTGLHTVADSLGLRPNVVELLLDQLIGQKVLVGTESEDERSFLPARPIDQIAVRDLVEADRPGARRAMMATCPRLREAIETLRARAADALAEATLADVLAGARGDDDRSPSA